MQKKTVKDISTEMRAARNDLDTHSLLIKLYRNDSRSGVQALLSREYKYLEKRRIKQQKQADLIREELKYIEKGYSLIAGVDEVGRGPLAGPVVAAAVVFPKDYYQSFMIDDSKKLTVEQREDIYQKIIKSALSVQIAVVSPAEIDKYNILNASLLAMRKAILQLSPKPDLVLVDGNEKVPNLNIVQHAIIKGDSKVRVIAAASIVAKVYRDRIMDHLANHFPMYQLQKHKGYPTKEHRELLIKHGSCSVYRQSFIRNYHEQ